MRKKALFVILGSLICFPSFYGSYTHTGKLSPGVFEKSEDTFRILLITGGHSFHKESFYRMFYSFDGFIIDTITQPAANQSLLSDSIEIYDVIVFYDMWQDISDQEKEAFSVLTHKGTGLVFLHHSLASYQEWDTFTQIIGGKYYEKGYDYPDNRFSGYKHDIVMDVTVLDTKHPVTLGLKDFEIRDEGYSNIGVLSLVTPLLVTDHPDCSETIAWTHNYNNSTVVYILLGHDNNAYSNDNFRKIVSNAIKWTGKNYD